MLQAATIAAKDVSALRKASGPDPVPKMQENGAFTLVARAARTRASSPAVRCRRDAVDATAPLQHNKKTQAPA